MFSELSSMRGTLEFPHNDDQKSPPNESVGRKKHHKTLSEDHVLFKVDDEERKKKDKKSFYFKMKFFSKISKFLQNLKYSSVLNEPDFRKSESRYMEMEEEGKNDELALIKYENKFSLLLKIICFFILLVCLWKASFEIVLGKLGTIYLMEILGILTCLLMIFLNLNSEMKNEKMTLIREKSQIREFYKQNILVKDILVVIGFLIILTPLDDMFQPIFYISRLLVLVLVSQVSDILSKILDRLTINRELQSTLSIIKLVFNILISLHLMSLLLTLFARLEKTMGVEVTWIEHNSFTGSKNYEIYIYAWYWSCTIMSTVGFGDITPAHRNIYQSILVALLEVICTILLSYFVSFIGELLKVIGQSKVAYNRDIRSLNDYLQKLKIDDRLRNEARSYLFNKYKTLEMFDRQEEERIGEQLSNKLKEKLLLMNNRTILEDSILMKYFGDQILDQLATVLQKEVYQHDEWIFEKQTSKRSIWLLEEGLIEEIVSKNLKNKPIFQTGKKNKFIGRVNFINGESYQSWGLSQIFTIAYKLSRDSFLEILKKFPQQYLKFFQIRDYLIQKDQKHQHQCLACGKLSHNVINCPKLHFVPKKINYIMQRKKCRAEVRGENMRKKRKRNQKTLNWFGNINLLKQTRKKQKKNKRFSLFDVPKMFSPLQSLQSLTRQRIHEETKDFLQKIVSESNIISEKSESSQPSNQSQKSSSLERKKSTKKNQSKPSKPSKSSKSSKSSKPSKSSKSSKQEKAPKQPKKPQEPKSSINLSQSDKQSEKHLEDSQIIIDTSREASICPSSVSQRISLNQTIYEPIIFDQFLDDEILWYKPNFNIEKILKWHHKYRSEQ